MNADIKGMLDFYKRRKITCLQSDKGEFLSDKEAKEYLRWCLNHGYEDLYSVIGNIYDNKELLKGE